MRLRNFLAATAVSTLALGALGVPAHANTAPDPAGAGMIAAWGDPDDANAGPAVINVPALTSPVTDVATNARASAAVTLDGGLHVWGKGDEVDEAPTGVTDATAVMVTVGHAGVLHEDGQISAWGPGDSLGDVPSGLRAKAFALQGNVGYAVRPDGTLATWGGAPATPLPSTGLTDLVDVSASLSHTVVLKADGTIRSWGPAAPGLNDDIPDFGGKKVVKIAAGYLFSAVILEDGSMRVWGAMAPTGIPTFDGLTPAGTVVDVGMAPVSPGLAAVTADGLVHTWGVPEYVAAVPSTVDAMPISAIALGNTHAVVVVTTFRKLAEPTISGTPEVGQTVSVTPSYSLTPGTSTGQWFTNAGPIDGETGSTLALTDAMVGAQIHYETSATRDGVTLESTTPTVAVAKATTTTALTVTPSAATAGRALVATATVTRAGGAPVGTLTFKVGTTTRIVPLAGGKATWTLPSQAVGTRAVTASYSGSPSSNASEAAPVTIRIAKAASKVKAQAKAYRKAKKVTFTISVTTATGVSPTGKVTITLKGKTKKTASVRVNAQGKASLIVKKLKPGKYTAKVTYAGNGNVSGSNGSVKFKI